MGCQVSTDLKPNQLGEVLDREQVLLVRATWNVLAEDMEGTGIVILTRLLENERRLRPLFLGLSCRPDTPPTNMGLIDKRKLRRHAILVMEALGAAVESLDDSSYLIGILRALGNTHANYNVTPEMLPRLWPAIDYGLGVRLQESYTSDVKEAWKNVYSFLISKMKKGMKEYDEMKKEKGKEAERRKSVVKL